MGAEVLHLRSGNSSLLLGKKKMETTINEQARKIESMSEKVAAKQARLEALE